MRRRTAKTQVVYWRRQAAALRRQLATERALTRAYKARYWNCWERLFDCRLEVERLEAIVMKFGAEPACEDGSHI